MAHNGSLIPVPGRDIMVQAWYQGGISVFDFTDSANAREIAYFDRGPINGAGLRVGRLLVDVLVQRQHLRRRDRARHRRVPAEAERVPVAERDRRGDAVPPAGVQLAEPAEGRVAGHVGVAKAYLDQLDRNKAISAERAKAVRDTLAKVDELRTGKERDAAARLDALERRGRHRSRRTRNRRPAAMRCGSRHWLKR